MRDHAAWRHRAGTPDRNRWVAARARTATQRSAQIEPVTATMPTPPAGQPLRWIDAQPLQQRGQRIELVRRQLCEVDLGQPFLQARECRYGSAGILAGGAVGPCDIVAAMTASALEPATRRILVLRR